VSLREFFIDSFRDGRREQGRWNRRHPVASTALSLTLWAVIIAAAWAVIR
jgi:hypothetical protein